MKDTLAGIVRDWIPPRGLEASPPRSVSLTRQGKFLMVAVLTLLLASPAAVVGLGGLARRQADAARRLREEGVLAEGTVTRLWQTSGRSSRPWMSYRFTVEGHTYVRNLGIPLRLWRQVKTGSNIPVRYVPSKPEINNPFNIVGEVVPRWLPFLLGALLAAGAFLATLPLRCQRRLLVEGRPCAGLVTGHGKMRRTSHGRERGQEYCYEFLQLSGAVAKGEAGPTRNPPEIGAVISVLCDRDDSSRNMPYPFALVEPERR